MFDARSILDALVKGGQPQGGGRAPAGGGDLGSIGDLLKQLGGADDRPPAPRERAPTRSARPAPEEAEEAEAPPPRRAPTRTRRASEEEADGPDARSSGGGLEDILKDVLGGKGGGLQDILEKLQKGGGLGGLGEILGPVLGQVLGGGQPGGAPRGGAARLTDDQVGSLADKFSQITGRSPEELYAQIKELIANNQFGAGAAAGGLGPLIFGTQTGRSMAATAAKLGGLALIGGLAYKAYMNYQQGAPAASGARQQALVAPPAGSGFEASTVTNDNATVMIRAMVAAAAADGRIDVSEQHKLVASLGGSGMSEAARTFVQNEIASPASVEEIAGAVSSQEEAIQVYTAARITVDPDLEEEHEFLAALAAALGLDEGLVAHVDAAARGAGTSV